MGDYMSPSTIATPYLMTEDEIQSAESDFEQYD